MTHTGSCANATTPKCKCGRLRWLLCRQHNQLKQTQGWILHQPLPGTLTWSSPAGLTRITTPTSYQM